MGFVIFMYYITYHQKVVDADIPKLSKRVKIRISKVIEEKLVLDPLRFGKFLGNRLFPFRSLRVGDYRVIFSIESKNEIFVILIEHRSIAYKMIYKRI